MTNEHYTSDGIQFISDDLRPCIVEDIKKRYWPLIRAKGSYLIIKPYVRPEKTAGGIILTAAATDEDQHHSVVGQVVDIGPLAYKEEKYCGGLVWAQIGDWVVVPRIEGVRLSFAEGDDVVPLRVVSDDKVIAIVRNPADWNIRINNTKF